MEVILFKIIFSQFLTRKWQKLMMSVGGESLTGSCRAHHHWHDQQTCFQWKESTMVKSRKYPIQARKTALVALPECNRKSLDVPLPHILTKHSMVLWNCFPWDWESNFDYIMNIEQILSSQLKSLKMILHESATSSSFMIDDNLIVEMIHAWHNWRQILAWYQCSTCLSYWCIQPQFDNNESLLYVS